MEWKNIETNPPPKGEDILGYTDENTMKIVRWTGKAFNTYLKILFWRYLPEEPKTKKDEGEEEPEKKKRGRKKENTVGNIMDNKCICCGKTIPDHWCANVREHHSSDGYGAIIELMKTLEVESMEELTGKYVCVESEGWAVKDSKNWAFSER